MTLISGALTRYESISLSFFYPSPTRALSACSLAALIAVRRPASLEDDLLSASILIVHNDAQ
jgi:hypothetical protein